MEMLNVSLAQAAKLKRLIRENRSIAENDPENLLSHLEAREVFNEIGSENFNTLVNNLLDDLE